jgi:hypothetical protein
MFWFQVCCTYAAEGTAYTKVLSEVEDIMYNQINFLDHPEARAHCVQGFDNAFKHERHYNSDEKFLIATYNETKHFFAAYEDLLVRSSDKSKKQW